MSDAASTEDRDCSLSLGGLVEEICDRAEAAWRAGPRPRIEDDLGAVPESGRAVLLRALLELELAYRHRNGERPTPEEYHRRFPHHAELIDAVFPQVDPPTSRADSVDDAVTQSYCVATPDGGLGPPLGFGGHRQLQAAFLPGVVLQGRYTLERELGRGGMGQVYLGRDDCLLRPVAIKVILPPGRGSWDGATSEVRFRAESFAEEARLGANLTHPAIATVYDFGVHEGKPFTVFEYLPGETLGDVLRRRGRLPLEEVRLILGPLAQALDFAHTRHVVHRDLKPENIRATEQGSFKVLDLGLAKDFHRHADWAGFCGTPAYASPEQAAGLACDGRSDQYALALIAFKMLTGHPVFEARDGKQLLEMHRTAVPIRVDDMLTDTPASVRQALSRALSKSPDRRFASCGYLAVALGCQFLSTPALPPPILLEIAVPRMTIGRYGRHVGVGWFRSPIRLALTGEALWSVHHAEVRRWRLRDIERVEPRPAPTKALATDTPTPAEKVRLAHCNREESILRIGEVHLYVFFLFLIIIFLSFIINKLIISIDRIGFWSSQWTVAVVLLGILSGPFLVVARGLRRFRPWARWAATCDVGVMALFSLTVALYIGIDVVRSNGVTGVVLLGGFFTPLLVLLAYPVYVLNSPQGKFVFSETYRAIMDQTPHLASPTFFPKPVELTLRLTLREVSGESQQVSFRFDSEEVCRSWAEQIAALLEHQPDIPGGAVEEPSPGPVVVLLQRPKMRYQVLGPLEARADTRQNAEAWLQARAATVGADAVLDVHEEVLPAFHRTVRRLSGTAVGAVDAEGRFELRSRWYADRITRIGNWIVTLLLVSYGAHLFGSALNSFMGPIFFETHETSLTSRLAIAGLFVTMIHAWPTTLAILLRLLRWPQLVRPLAVTIVALGSLSMFSLIAKSLGALSTGRWGGLAYHLLWYLDPINVILLLSGLVVCRAAWRADHEYRRLVPEDVRRAPWRRVLGGRLAWAAAVSYVLLLAGFSLWAGVLSASQFRLPSLARPSTASPQRHLALTAPENWTDIAPRRIQVPGEVIRAWSTQEGAVVAVFDQKPGQALTPRALLDTSVQSVKQQLQAEVTAAEVTTVAGMRAMWLVFTTRGTGRAIGGAGNVPTTHHWIAIPRENDVLVLWLTAPSDRFQAASQEFSEMLDTLKVDGKQTKEQAESK